MLLDTLNINHVGSIWKRHEEWSRRFDIYILGGDTADIRGRTTSIVKPPPGAFVQPMRPAALPYHARCSLALSRGCCAVTWKLSCHVFPVTFVLWHLSNLSCGPTKVGGEGNWWAFSVGRYGGRCRVAAFFPLPIATHDESQDTQHPRILNPTLNLPPTPPPLPSHSQQQQHLVQQPSPP